MPIPGASMMASGTINPCRFIRIDPASNNCVLQGTAAGVPFGISQEGTELPPITAWGLGTQAVSAGHNVRFYQPGEVCLVEIAAAVTAGDFLRSDNNGRAVTAANGFYAGAQALASGGALGEKVLCRVITPTNPI